MRKMILPLALAIALIGLPAEGHVRNSTWHQRRHIARRVVARLGADYCWGGTRGCFDCSGLTLRVFRDHGARLPHSTRRQWRARHRDGWRTLPHRANLRRGDLIFFRNTYRDGISHVGIYIGDQKFVHAGDQVTKDSLGTRYWRRHFAGGVRPRALRFG